MQLVTTQDPHQVWILNNTGQKLEISPKLIREIQELKVDPSQIDLECLWDIVKKENAKNSFVNQVTVPTNDPALWPECRTCDGDGLCYVSNDIIPCPKCHKAYYEAMPLSQFTAFTKAWPMTKKTHPAKFSTGFVEVFRQILHAFLEKPWKYDTPLVLDPFAGVGTIHQLRPEFATFGIEIEGEWAKESEHTFWGDSRIMNPHWTDMFQAIVTSPTYGNRMADHHKPGPCSDCGGEGKITTTLEITKIGDMERQFLKEECVKCNGTGIESSKRNTYRHTLGHELSSTNTGMYQFTQDLYKGLHMEVYAECKRVLEPNGVFILNVSDHIRKGEVMPVVQWHHDALEGMGFKLHETKRVPTQRLGFGANDKLRVPYEVIAVYRKGI